MGAKGNESIELSTSTLTARLAAAAAAVASRKKKNMSMLLNAPPFLPSFCFVFFYLIDVIMLIVALL